MKLYDLSLWDVPVLPCSSVISFLNQPCYYGMSIKTKLSLQVNYLQG